MDIVINERTMSESEKNRTPLCGREYLSRGQPGLRKKRQKRPIIA